MFRLQAFILICIVSPQIKSIRHDTGRNFWIGLWTVRGLALAKVVDHRWNSTQPLDAHSRMPRNRSFGDYFGCSRRVSSLSHTKLKKNRIGLLRSENPLLFKFWGGGNLCLKDEKSKRKFCQLLRAIPAYEKFARGRIVTNRRSDFYFMCDIILLAPYSD